MSEQRTCTTHPLKIAQLNIQKKKHATIQLLNNHTTDFDIILIQEPAWGFIGRDPSGTEIKGPVALQGWNTILPVTSVNNTSPRPRTLTYFKPRPDFTITVRSDIIEDRDIQFLDITQGDHPKVSLINIYNDTSLGAECILNKIRHPNIIPSHPTLITGDFNLHHPLWSKDDRLENPDRLTTDITDWLTQSNLTLLNPKGEITHLARHGGERPSVIDLSFANPEACTQDTFKEWAIDPAISHDSDHNGIKFTIDHGLKEIDNTLGIKYSLNKVDPGEWTKCFEDELSEVSNALNTFYANETPSDDQLDEYATILSTAIQKAIAKAAKERTPSTNAKPWWDAELSAAAKNVANARLAQQSFQQLTGEYSAPLQVNIARNRNFFKRLCKYKKKEWATKTLESASTNDIWSFPNWSKGIRNYPTPPISKGPNLPKATTHEEKCEALRNELYQPPQPLTETTNPT